METALLLIAFIAAVIGVNAVFSSKKQTKRGWKTHRNGKDAHSYSELFEGSWRSIELKSEWFSKNAPRHVIYIQKDWAFFPQWAQERKEIIISRLEQEFKPPTFTLIEIDN
ncbi:MAG: hypothetical protein GQ574_16550 [Crocinitomix sp.]|nr:hypothetical protein [Crocinitomix sp.]